MRLNKEEAKAIEAEIPYLRRYARALTGGQDAADDLVQDALERAIDGLISSGRAPTCARGCSRSCTICAAISIAALLRRPMEIPIEDAAHQMCTRASQADALAPAGFQACLRSPERAAPGGAGVDRDRGTGLSARGGHPRRRGGYREIPGVPRTREPAPRAADARAARDRADVACGSIVTRVMSGSIELVIITPAEVSAFVDGELSPRSELMSRHACVMTIAPPACSRRGSGSARSSMRRLAASWKSPRPRRLRLTARVEPYPGSPEHARTSSARLGSPLRTGDHRLSRVRRDAGVERGSQADVSPGSME